MSATLAQAKRYAALKKTAVFETAGGYALNEDGSITFVLLSGPKLTMFQNELEQSISEMENTRELENKILEIQSEPPKSKTRRVEPVETKQKEK